MLDLFMIYNFIRRLVTPFSEWDAYKLGIIDERGKVLRKRRQLRRSEEKEAFGVFDVLVLNLKKLLERLPAGQTRIASYAAALWLIREHKAFTPESMLTEDMSDEQIQESVNLFFSGYTDYTTLQESVKEKMPDFNELFEEKFQLDELFDKPSSFRKTTDNHDKVIYDSSIGDKKLIIYFNKWNSKIDKWEMFFSVDGKVGVTGDGDEYQIFATVLAAIENFIKAKKPEILTFTSENKQGLGQGSDETSIRKSSRTKLYERMIKRFAKGAGYSFSTGIKSHRGRKMTEFILTKEVNEGAPTVSVAAGGVSGLTKDDLPGLTRAQQRRHRRRTSKKKKLRDIVGDTL